MTSQNPMYTDKLIKEKMTGMVIRYDADKKFGFIRADDRTVTDDIFVYFNQIIPKESDGKKPFLKLHQCQEVTFDLYMSNKGMVAKNVISGEILTEILINKCKKLIAVEIDARLVNELQNMNVYEIYKKRTTNARIAA
jgi:cold shock CspA family protein